MKPPLFTPHALSILARSPDGRVELQRHRERARSQQKQLREEIEAQSIRLTQLGDLVDCIDRLLGRPVACVPAPVGATQSLFGTGGVRG